MHKRIWDEVVEEPFELVGHKDRILASYEAGEEKTAFVEMIGVGDSLPPMPLFHYPGYHMKVPLEASYVETWSTCPKSLQDVVMHTQ